MKHLIILFLILIPVVANCQFLPAGYDLQKSQSDGKYYSIFNTENMTGGIINMDLNSIDTNFVFVKNQSDGKYSSITNKHILFGAAPGTISASLIYLLNNNLAQTDKDNTFTATQYFNRLVCDTMIVNHIDSVHSTYWFSNTGDIIGYIDAGTEKVAFFKQMTIGNLTTNTTVAENFIRSNQVQTDTLIPHSPLIIAGDTTIAKKIFADSIMTQKVKAGNILINGSNKTISGVDTVIIGNQRKIYVASNGWARIEDGLWTPYLFSYRLTGGTNALTTSNDSVFILAGNGVNTNSIYNQNFLISGVRGEYLSMSNIRYIRLGWTSDSVAVLEPYNSGQWTKRPFVITADTVKSTVFKSSSLYSPTAIFNPTAEPSTPLPGQIYFNSTDNKFYGYNGTAWKQLDN